jgi:branched-chain amino acid transport system substrate-binding protein
MVREVRLSARTFPRFIQDTLPSIFLNSKNTGMSKILKYMHITTACFLFFFLMINVSYAGDTIKIGVGAPFSGAVAALGTTLKTGFDFATQQINARGGIHGRQLEIIYVDDVCNPAQALVVASQLIQKKVIASTHICDAASEAAKSVYVENNVLFFPITRLSSITKNGGGITFQSMVSHEDYARTIAAELFPKYSKKKIAILSTNDLYGQGLPQNLKKIFAEQGRSFDYEEIFTDPLIKDYSATITKLKNAKVDVVVLSIWDNMVANFMRQAGQQQLKAFFISTDSGGDMAIPQVAGKTSEELVFASVNFIDRLNADTKLMADMKMAQFSPNPSALYGYFAMELLAAAIEKSADLSAKNLASSFKSNTLKTFAGDITFDYEGDLHGLTTKLYTWKNGEIVSYQKQ